MYDDEKLEQVIRKMEHYGHYGWPKRTATASEEEKPAQGVGDFQQRSKIKVDRVASHKRGLDHVATVITSEKYQQIIVVCTNHWSYALCW
jgi:hypothetical protein